MISWHERRQDPRVWAGMEVQAVYYLAKQQEVSKVLRAACSYSAGVQDMYL
jgi:hypothetical protein